MKTRALLYTLGSPFARAIRIILDELELDYERCEATPTVEERATFTPTLQVPTFLDGEIRLWESGLIAEYLLQTYLDRPRSTPPLAAHAWRPDQIWRDKLVSSTIQTLGTAITTIWQVQVGGTKENSYLTRCAERIPHLMDWLEEELPEGGAGFLPAVVSVQDIFLACHLRFAENRPLLTEVRSENYPKISVLLSSLDDRMSFRSNPVRWWEPGVVGYQVDGSPVYER